MIVGFGHKKRVGKDTAADYLVKEHGFVKLSFADEIRSIAKTTFNLTDEQLLGRDKEKKIESWNNKSPRDICIGIGQGLRKIDPDVWIKKTIKKAVYFHDIVKKDVVIADVRFRGEADGIRHVGGWVGKIERPFIFNQQHSLFEKLQLKYFGRMFLTKKHISETELDQYKDWDFVIQNAIEDDFDLFYKQVDNYRKTCEILDRTNKALRDNNS